MNIEVNILINAINNEIQKRFNLNLFYKEIDNGYDIDVRY